MSELFTNPAMVWGAAAGSAPIIIHLLNKQRFKRVIWAAMHFLWQAHKKSRKRLQVEQLILLLIRTLVVILLALAMAGLFFPSLVASRATAALLLGMAVCVFGLLFLELYGRRLILGLCLLAVAGMVLWGVISGGVDLPKVAVLLASLAVGALFVFWPQERPLLWLGRGMFVLAGLAGIIYFAASMFFGAGAGAEERAAGAKAYLIVALDNSYSMARKVGNRPVFESAKELAKGLLELLRSGDRASFLLFNGEVEPVIETPLADRAALLEAVEGARLSDGHTDCPKALAKAYQMANQVDQTYRIEIYLITDGQKSGWYVPGLQETPRHFTSDQLRLINEVRESRKPQVYLIHDFGQQETDNLCLESVEVKEAVVMAKELVDLEVGVRNFGNRQQENLTLTLEVAGKAVKTEEIPRLGARQQVRKRLQYAFPEPGSYPLTVKVTATGSLVLDDFRHLALDVRREVKVLGVDGDRKTGSLQGELDLLKLNLNPQQELRTEGDPYAAGYQMRIVEESEFEGVSLTGYDLVILGNVGSVSEERARALAQYVQRGGGLLIFLGDLVDKVLYNRRLYPESPGKEKPRDNEAAKLREKVAEDSSPLPAEQPAAPGGKDQPSGPVKILPARLLGYEGDPNDKSKYITLSPLEQNHEVVALFAPARTGGVNLGSGRIFRWYRVDPGYQKEGEVGVILKYENGEPALLERRLGAGKVVLATLTADPEWHDLYTYLRHLWAIIIPRLADYLVHVPHQERNCLVGGTVSATFLGDDMAVALREGAVLATPGGTEAKERLPMRVAAENDRATAQSALLPRAGIYRLELGSNPPLFFAANVDTEQESDLETLDYERELKTEKAFAAVAFKPVPSDLERIKKERLQAVRGYEWWRSLVWVVLGLLVFESILAQRWGDQDRLGRLKYAEQYFFRWAGRVLSSLRGTTT